MKFPAGVGLKGVGMYDRGNSEITFWGYQKSIPGGSGAPEIKIPGGGALRKLNSGGGRGKKNLPTSPPLISKKSVKA